MTENSKYLSHFEKYKGYSSSLFSGNEWAEFDAFVAGIELALEVASEKAEVQADGMVDCLDSVKVNKNSILNSLK